MLNTHCIQSLKANHKLFFLKTFFFSLYIFFAFERVHGYHVKFFLQLAATASAAIESKQKCCYRRRCVFRLYFGRFSLSHDFRLQTNTFIFCIIISMTTHFHFVCLSSVSFSLLLVLLLRLLCVSAFFARHSIMFIGRLNSIGLCAMCMYIVQLNIVQMYFVMWLSNSLIYRNFQLHVE